MISFEENMECMDLTRASCNCVIKRIESEHQSNGRYIHQLRTDPQKRPGAGNYAFFHIELEDDDGSTLYLPGQMTAKAEYQWSDGVEPVLLDILNGVAVCKTKGGGTS